MTFLRLGREKEIRQGDKQMLIDSLVESYRELTGQTFEALPVNTVPVSRSAANADRFEKAEKQARRQRRQRRLERSEHRSINGWTVRAW